MGKYRQKLREVLGQTNPGPEQTNPVPGQTNPVPPGPTPVKPKETKAKMPNKNNWTQTQVGLVDGSFSYWGAKSGTSIFVDVDQLSNVPLLTPAVARKLFPK